MKYLQNAHIMPFFLACALPRFKCCFLPDILKFGGLGAYDSIVHVRRTLDGIVVRASGEDNQNVIFYMLN